jgi:hypothetical protein
MKSLGYALLLAGLVGGGIFMANLLSGMAREQCNRNCPDDPNGVRKVFDIGFVKYEECMCK